MCLLINKIRMKSRKGDFTVNRMMKIAAAALLVMLLMTMTALAAETTALAPSAQGEPTEKGEIVAKKISDKISGVLDEISADLSEEERNAFYKSLAVIR